MKSEKEAGAEGSSVAKIKKELSLITDTMRELEKIQRENLSHSEQSLKNLRALGIDSIYNLDAFKEAKRALEQQVGVFSNYKSTKEYDAFLKKMGKKEIVIGDVYNNKALRDSFLAFAKSQYALEQVEFLLRMKEVEDKALNKKVSKEELDQELKKIYDEFIRPGSEKQINISSDQRRNSLYLGALQSRQTKTRKSLEAALEYRNAKNPVEYLEVLAKREATLFQGGAAVAGRRFFSTEKAKIEEDQLGKHAKAFLERVSKGAFNPPLTDEKIKNIEAAFNALEKDILEDPAWGKFFDNVIKTLNTEQQNKLKDDILNAYRFRIFGAIKEGNQLNDMFQQVNSVFLEQRRQALQKQEPLTLQRVVANRVAAIFNAGLKDKPINKELIEDIEKNFQAHFEKMKAYYGRELVGKALKSHRQFLIDSNPSLKKEIEDNLRKKIDDNLNKIKRSLNVHNQGSLSSGLKKQLGDNPIKKELEAYIDKQISRMLVERKGMIEKFSDELAKLLPYLVLHQEKHKDDNPEQQQRRRKSFLGSLGSDREENYRIIEGLLKEVREFLNKINDPRGSRDTLNIQDLMNIKNRLEEAQKRHKEASGFISNAGQIWSELDGALKNITEAISTPPPSPRNKEALSVSSKTTTHLKQGPI